MTSPNFSNDMNDLESESCTEPAIHDLRSTALPLCGRPSQYFGVRGLALCGTTGVDTVTALRRQHEASLATFVQRAASVLFLAIDY